MGIDSIMTAAPVIPVMVIDNPSQAVPIAQALVAGGLKVLEITLRTASALESIRRIKAEVDGAIVGAGTVLTPDQLDEVERAGCAFAVSPGFTPLLLDAADNHSCPLLPGASSAAEAMQLLERGYTRQKFFPAGPAGGPAYLRALASPLPKIGFCPTGGVAAANASDYLALPNVLCVGGSWVTPKAAIEARDWALLTDLAEQATRLKIRAV